MHQHADLTKYTKPYSMPRHIHILLVGCLLLGSSCATLMAQLVVENSTFLGIVAPYRKRPGNSGGIWYLTHAAEENKALRLMVHQLRKQVGPMTCSLTWV